MGPGPSTRPMNEEKEPPIDHFRAQYESIYAVFTGGHRTLKYHRFLPITVKGKQCSALIDSGNTWRNVISVAMMKNLGYTLDDLVPLRNSGINTARTGDQLEILGELPEDVQMTLGQTTITLPTRPVVLRDLAMPFNICGPFMQKHRIDQIHSKNALQCGGKLLPLMTCDSLAAPARENVPESSLVVIASPVTIQPFYSAVVSLSVLDVLNNRMEPGPGIIYASDHFMKTTDTNPTLCSLVEPCKLGSSYTTVLNTSNQPIRLRSGVAFGTFRPLQEKENDYCPWKVAALQTKSRPTLQARLKELLDRCREENKKKPNVQDRKKELDVAMMTDEGKRKWLFNAFQLDRCPQLVNDEWRAAVVELLLKYWDCISISGEFGKTHLLQHEIHTEPGPPITTRYRPVNPALLPDLHKQIDELLHHNVIEPSNSPWSFALVAAPKKNGKIRWCVDYRRLNAITRRDQFPLPNIEDNLARLSKSTVFFFYLYSGGALWLGALLSDTRGGIFYTPSITILSWKIEPSRAIYTVVYTSKVDILKNVESGRWLEPRPTRLLVRHATNCAMARPPKSTVFSCLDGSGAFHVLEIRKEDRPKTAFSTPWGLYQYKRMPFGLCNGPASYSRLVQLVLQGIPPESALPYLDDTIVHSPTVQQHFKDLGAVLAAHQKAGLKLQPAKCQLFQKEVAYLGHLISQEGIRPLPDYVKVVQDWPIPTTKSEARVFLGKVGYYRRFIKDYQAIARHWTEVTGKDKEGETATDDDKLVVTSEMKQSFELLKKKLLEAPILAYPQFDSAEPFILDTDWSQETGAIGGVLSQKQDGLERVISYGAKKLGQAQMNYTAGKENCQLSCTSSTTGHTIYVIVPLSSELTTSL